jgi:anti-anti-sigma factor
MAMATPELQVGVRERDGALVVDLVGDIDGAADGALVEVYAHVAGSAVDALVLNFEATSYINSTGIALIVGLLSKARRDRIKVSAFGLSDHYREIFEITRLSDFMTIADSEEGAVSNDA